MDGVSGTLSWYNEVKDYDFTSTPYTYNPKCGHFSQVVWADSKEFGVGLATAKNGMHFMVARYAPGGNNLNLFKSNIKPPVGSNQITGTDEDVGIPSAETPENEGTGIQLYNYTLNSQ